MHGENIAIDKLIGGVVIAVNGRCAVAFALQGGEVERVKIHAAQIDDGGAAFWHHLALCRAYLVPEDIAITADLCACIEAKLERSLYGSGAIGNDGVGGGSRGCCGVALRRCCGIDIRLGSRGGVGVALRISGRGGIGYARLGGCGGIDICLYQLLWLGISGRGGIAACQCCSGLVSLS